MKILKFLIPLIVFAYSVNAQAPWRAKLFVHFKDSTNKIVTDTVWFGCDSLGDVGFQPGLDIIDTNLKYNHVYASDDLVKARFNADCANLKKNIHGFRKKESSFKFYAIGNPISMSWDTMDFKYFDSTYRLSYIEIKPQNGYVNGIDGKFYVIAGDNYYLINGQYVFDKFCMFKDSIILLPESFLTECNFSKLIFSFNINIYMSWRWVSGIDDPIELEEPKVYPNPFFDKLIVDQENSQIKLKEIKIYSIDGQLELQKEIADNKIEIETNILKSGIYLIYITDDSTNQYCKPIKLIKL